MKPELTCKEVARLISEGLDAELPAHERARMRLHVVLCSSVVLRQPHGATAGRTGKKIEQHLMLPQHPLLPVFYQRIENAMSRKQLPWVLFDPKPRSHFKRQRQKDMFRRQQTLAVEVVPQVTVGQVLQALWLKNVTVVAV